MTTLLTEEQFKAALPDTLKKSVNQELIDRINNTLSDPELLENYRDNLISYTSVMKNGKFRIDQYLEAVKYVSFKLMGHTNIEAYSRTFPEKIERFNAEGVSSKDVASYVTAYNKGKLVNLIMEQTLIPVHVLNLDLYQSALNVQAKLMVDPTVSPKVRSDAANSLLVQLKPPEAKKVELEISTKEDSSIDMLRRSTMEYVAQQREMLKGGMMTAQDAAHQKLNVIDVDVKEVTDV